MLVQAKGLTADNLRMGNMDFFKTRGKALKQNKTKKPKQKQKTKQDKQK